MCNCEIRIEWKPNKHNPTCSGASQTKAVYFFLLVMAPFIVPRGYSQPLAHQPQLPPFVHTSLYLTAIRFPIFLPGLAPDIIPRGHPRLLPRLPQLPHYVRSFYFPAIPSPIFLSIHPLIPSQAIAVASWYLHEGPLLVVCPASLRLHWAEQLERWLPQLCPQQIHLGELKTLSFLWQDSGLGVALTPTSQTQVISTVF